ncbi:MAG TPA: RNA polymerase subunit sigma-70, partial [Flavobacteriaceae bacterium]|nr:RNA polymerase subunit sigma-70 [Flavobacteriaceae bacterium]
MAEKPKNVCEEDVFNHIFNTYIKDVRRFIYSKTRDLEVAEDIVQDTFVKIWENCATVISIDT